MLGEVADRAGGELQGGEQLGDALDPLDGGEHIVDVAGCLADRSGCAADLGAAQRDVAPRQEVVEGGDGHVKVRRQARAQHVEVKLAALLRRVDDLRDGGARRRELDRASLDALHDEHHVGRGERRRPQPVAELDQLAHLGQRRSDRLGPRECELLGADEVLDAQFHRPGDAHVTEQE